MKLIIRNLNSYNEKNVALESDIEQTTKLVKTLLNIKNKIDKSDEAESQHRMLNRKKRKPTVFNRYEPPQTIKLSDQVSIRTHEIDWRNIDQVEVVPLTVDRFIKVSPEVDLKKGWVIITQHDKVVVEAESKDSLVKAIKAAVDKYTENEEFYDERIQLWRKKYVESEAQGIETFNNFKANNPRPQYGENNFKVGKTELKVSDFIDIKKNWMERNLFSNPYMMLDSQFDFRPQREDQVQQSANNLVRKIENERIDALRSSSERLKINALSVEEFIDSKYQELNANWKSIVVETTTLENKVVSV